MKTTLAALTVCGLMLVSVITAARTDPPDAPFGGNRYWAAFDGPMGQDCLDWNLRVGGCESNGAILWVCIAKYKGGVHPGKVRPGFKGCNIPYGGREIAIPSYRVLLELSWTGARYSMNSISLYRMLQSDLVAGREANGDPLWACRARYEGGFHPGKVRPGFKGCNIPYGGREIAIDDFQLLEHWWE